MSLFAQAQAQQGPKPLVEFKAGKMNKDGNMIKPDKRKGTLQLIQSDDGLVHLVWKDRSNGRTEDDLILFPGDATFSKVTRCTTGNVYLLDFAGQGKKLFFWLQDKSEKEDWVKKLNDNINNPPPAGAGGDMEGLAAAAGGQGGLGGLASLLSGAGGVGGLDRQQLLSLLSGFQQPGSSAFSPSLPVPGQMTSPSSGPTQTTQAYMEPVGGPRIGAPTGDSNKSGNNNTSNNQPNESNTTSTTQAANQDANLQLSDLQNILQGLSGQQQQGVTGFLDAVQKEADSKQTSSSSGDKKDEDKKDDKKKEDKKDDMDVDK